MGTGNTRDKELMRRCLRLARRGEGFVSPNPMVGCVVVKGGRVIAEGFHRRFGGPHAEREALKKAGKRARGGTLYVNLEPCSHHGKTAPCVEAILEAGIGRVVIGTVDPNPLVAGRGIRMLRQAGVKVVVGVERREAEALNERFLTFMKTGLPFVAVKMAQTLDGRIADQRGDSKWITGREARKEARRLRTLYDAILVGAATVRQDDPLLTVRGVRGRQPVRVVLDGKFTSPVGARVFDARRYPTILITTESTARNAQSKLHAMQKKDVEVVVLRGNGVLKSVDVLRLLARRGISSVLVEGGSVTTSSFLDARLVHRMYCFLAPKVLGGGVESLSLKRPLRLARAIRIVDPTVRQFEHDVLVEGKVAFR